MTKTTRAKLALTAVALAVMAASAGALLGPRLRREPPRLAGPLAFRAEATDGGPARELSAGDLLGQIWVADFAFTRCSGPCPILGSNVARLQKTLPREVRFVTFTVDPDSDSTEVLARYAGRLGAEPGRWLFARLEPRPLFELAVAGFKLPVYIDPKAEPGSRSIHSTKLVLVDRAGVVRGYYDGLSEGGLDDLKRDLGKLVATEQSHV